MIYAANIAGADWLTVIVRADDETEAQRLAGEVAARYQGDEYEGCTVRALDMTGPPAVIYESVG